VPGRRPGPRIAYTGLAMTYNRAFATTLLVVALAAWPLGAQTTPSTAASHRDTTAATHHAAGGCVTVGDLSPKIPSLPATAPCPKTLYKVTRIPTTKLDYASPMLSESVRQELGEGPETFSLDYVDTKIGTGPTVEQHKCLSVQYTGYLTNGTKFDSSHDRPGNQPIEFFYGGHQVIPGWDTGFEGMRMGGERRLFVPYQLAYGENGRGPIPAKAELIFDVEAVSQSEPHAGAPPGGQCMRTPPPPAHRPETPPSGAAPRGATPPAGSTPPANGGTPPPSSTTTTPPQTQSKPQK
jgi:peptidylprolyl isomerase